MHFPADPLQPGPIFFLTPRKCSIFGVHCEAIPRQINFLTDEAADCGKGANVVISQLHYFFSNHGLGEKVVYLHCDNCTGQNKNSFMVQYLMWRKDIQKLHFHLWSWAIQNSHLTGALALLKDYSAEQKSASLKILL